MIATLLRRRYKPGRDEFTARTCEFEFDATEQDNTIEVRHVPLRNIEVGDEVIIKGSVFFIKRIELMQGRIILELQAPLEHFDAGRRYYPTPKEIYKGMEVKELEQEGRTMTDQEIIDYINSNGTPEYAIESYIIAAYGYETEWNMVHYPEAASGTKADSEAAKARMKVIIMENMGKTLVEIYEIANFYLNSRNIKYKK